MTQCLDCGGEMLGDGYKTPVRCEYSLEKDYEYNEPDANPVYCGYVDQDFEVSTDAII